MPDQDVRKPQNKSRPAPPAIDDASSSTLMLAEGYLPPPLVLLASIGNVLVPSRRPSRPPQAAHPRYWPTVEVSCLKAEALVQVNTHTERRRSPGVSPGLGHRDRGRAGYGARRPGRQWRRGDRRVPPASPRRHVDGPAPARHQR